MSQIALLLFGISYLDNFNHWHSRNYNIDWKCSFENYQYFIIQYFQKKGYQVDIFLVSNKINNIEKNKLLEGYKPIKFDFIENKENVHYSRNEKFNRVIDLCLKTNINYKMICITRFDLKFQKNFDNYLINENTFNIVSKLEKTNYICDNFYILPYKYIHSFSNLVKNNLYTNFHKIEKDIQKIGPINYLHNENVKISSLSFYKIVRNIAFINKINNSQKTIYYCFKKHFSKKNNTITSIKDTIIKINMSHSNELKANEKKIILCEKSFQIIDEVKDYYMIKI